MISSFNYQFPKLPISVFKYSAFICQKGKKIDEILFCYQIISHLLKNITPTSTPLCFIIPVSSIQTWPKVSHRLQFLKTRQELKDLLPSSHTLLLAGSFSSLLCWLLHKATQNTASPRARNPGNIKERIRTQQPQFFYDLTLEVAVHPFDLILSTEVNTSNEERN